MNSRSVTSVILALMTITGSSALAQGPATSTPAGNRSIGKMEIASISPTSGGPGTLMVIHGTGFGVGSPDEFCLMTRGARSINLRARSRTDTTIVAEVLGVPKNALPGPIMIMRGMGGLTTIPPYSGVIFEDDVFGFIGDANNPSTMALSTQVFTPIEGPSVQSGCDPSEYEFVEWQLIQRELCLQLPDDWCDDDFGLISLDFVLDTGVAWDVIAESIDYGSGTSSIVRGEALEFAINSLFSDWGLLCFASFDPTTNKLSVGCPGSSFMAYSGYFERFYGPTTVTSIQDEIDDDFTTPTPTNLISGSPFETWVIANCPGGTSKMFDEWDDGCFAHTMTFSPGPVLSATLEIRLGAHQSNPNNDSIRLGFSGGAPLWVGTIESLVGTWNPGDTTTLCLDLEYIPHTGGTWTSILDYLESGELDVVVDNESVVDYVALRIRRCD